jgi:AcrR family transcriptional regulator
VAQTKPSTRTIRVPRQSRGKATREQLLQGGAKAFGDHGYAGATARVIAVTSGVSVGTLYQYFEDRDHLLQQLAASRAMGIGARVLTLMRAPADPDRDLAQQLAEQLRLVVEEVTEYHRQDQALHAVLTERRHADPEIDRITTAAERHMVDEITGLLNRWGRQGDVQALAFILYHMVEGAVHAHVLGTPLISDERFITSLVDTATRLAAPSKE